MRKFRTVLLLVVLGGLTIFAFQNTSPSLPLVFLGTTSIALPLSVWIVAAIALGALTAWIISNLFGLSNYWGGREDRPRRPRGPRPLEPIEPPPGVNASRVEPAETANWRTQATTIQDNTGENWRRTTESVRVTNANESDEDNWIDEDEDFIDENEVPRANYTEDRQYQTHEREYEVVREPSSESWSGSMYSYSYEQRRDSVGAEPNSPYEPDYRIVTPPPATPEAVTPVENPPEAIDTEPEETPTPPDLQPGTSEADDWTRNRRRSEEW